MSEDELERPCWICSNSRKESIGQYWRDIPKLHTTDEYCGHRERELTQDRQRERRKSVASEVRYRSLSPIRVA